MVERLYVEKKQGFDVEAQGCCKDFKENIGIPGLLSVRILNRYDIEGIEKEDLEKAVHTVFSEPPVDTVSRKADFDKKKEFYSLLFASPQFAAKQKPYPLQDIALPEVPVFAHHRRCDRL